MQKMHPEWPTGKYKVILSDPQWVFKNYNDANASRWVGGHYPLMITEDICNLPVQSIADDDCILFIWGTWPMSPACYRVIDAWGFCFKTAGFVWIKTNKNGGIFMGTGYWTRANSEFCLLATKGHPKRIDAGVPQVVMHPRLKHSQKPAVVRDRIVQLVGDLPRIEMFARQRVPGWDSWGLEVPDIPETLFDYEHAESAQELVLPT